MFAEVLGVLRCHMRTSRLATLLASVALVAASPAVAGTVTIQDDLQSGDEPHRDINIKSLTVTYNAKGASATLRLKDFRKLSLIHI